VLTVDQVSNTSLAGVIAGTGSLTKAGTGTLTLTLTFQSGTDADIAQVQVQNKLQLAMPLLPQEVQQQGIQVKKSSSSFLMVAGFVSEDGSMT